jgi:hypothetical protein
VNGRLLVRLPVELADELEQQGLAAPVPAVRSGLDLVPGIALTAIEVVTTVITLAEAPTIFRDLAAMLVKWRKSQPAAKPGDIVVSVTGPGGTARLQLNQAVSEDQIAQVLELVTRNPP